ncbi:myb-like protein W [Teleopsis dalmanni]|uniref:myb-like protein W n=1 Tax=Teleopsis dalmanni TaxID=139649 RepID=UPI0018CF2011|nr:myb-like protein W [Teleopsis dalmanni]XP_037943207.1 myb-like protein W [Teleopsis dalmanni]
MPNSSTNNINNGNNNNNMDSSNVNNSINNNNNNSISNFNNQEISHFIANSPTAATYVQAQLNGLNIEAADNAAAANAIPIVTYNGNQYCVITRSGGVIEPNLTEKPELLHFRGQLTTTIDKQGKANFILMSPLQMQTEAENPN